MRGWIMVRRCYLQREAPLVVPLKRPCGLLPVRPDKPGRRASGRLEALGARCGDFSSDDALELVDRAVQLVIDDRVGELAGELALLEGLREALPDLAFAFGTASPQPPLELLAIRSRDEDRDAARDPVAHSQGAAGL